MFLYHPQEHRNHKSFPFFSFSKLEMGPIYSKPLDFRKPNFPKAAGPLLTQLDHSYTPLPQIMNHRKLRHHDSTGDEGWQLNWVLDLLFFLAPSLNPTPINGFYAPI